jgi:cysteinyl-tRNA synthetase
MKYLGETIDIHTGGIDHIPVHHENEIAQSESASHKPFARYFVHNAFLVGKEGTKISKSAGKFPLLSDLAAAGIDPLAFRIFCYGAKYRSEIAFNDESIRAAQSNLDYFREFARSVPDDAAADGVEAAGWAAEFYERFHDAINNDLNTPQAIAVALDLIAEAYRRKDFRAWPTLLALDSVLGLELGKHREAARGGSIGEDVQHLIDNRAAARKAKDFATADELRKEIERRGYEVKDNRDGTATYRRRGG